MVYRKSPFSLMWQFGRRKGLTLALVTSVFVAPTAAAPRPASHDQSALSPLTLYVSRFLDVAKSAGEAGKTGHAYPAMEKLLGLPSDAGSMTAFEENRLFVYGEARYRDSAVGSTWHRRIIFLKPSTFIVDDFGTSRGGKKPAAWQLFSPGPWSTRSSKSQSETAGGPIVVETFLPKKSIRQMFLGVIRVDGDGSLPPDQNLLEVESQGDPRSARFLHLLEIATASVQTSRASATLAQIDQKVHFTVTSGQRIFRWSRHDAEEESGAIEITSVDGGNVLSKRPLPSGIMPHTPEGARLLEVWDGDYRDGKHPKWDTGQPSADLVKAIDEGIFKPGRVIEFGCGTGTDAIYMASRGFDVTAIDISPSAIAQALEKAREAGTKVRFMLADALNPPEVGQFDFIYDRACYHEVRGQNLGAYLETLKKVSRPGTKLLLLAGNSNGPDLGFGPPTVSEEELRFDFTPLFNIEWLKESRFEVFPAEAGFPLAWCVLMKRK